MLGTCRNATVSTITTKGTGLTLNVPMQGQIGSCKLLILGVDAGFILAAPAGVDDSVAIVLHIVSPCSKGRIRRYEGLTA